MITFFRCLKYIDVLLIMSKVQIINFEYLPCFPWSILYNGANTVYPDVISLRQ